MESTVNVYNLFFSFFLTDTEHLSAVYRRADELLAVQWCFRT